MTEIEKGYQLFKIVDDGDIFDPLEEINSQSGKWMSFEYFDDEMDGVFPRVSDYTRWANKIDEEGAAAYLTWAGKGKLKFNTGYCTVIREGKNDNKAIIEFKEPIKVVVAEVNGEPVLIETDRIRGEFTHEWMWWSEKHGKKRQDSIANVCEIWFDCQHFELRDKTKAKK